LPFLCIALTACQTVAIDAQFPPAPPDVVACSKTFAVDVPGRDLRADETEKWWNTDRISIKKLRGCLQRLVVRDNKLARQK